jgi:hypothetical protein
VRAFIIVVAILALTALTALALIQYGRSRVLAAVHRTIGAPSVCTYERFMCREDDPYGRGRTTYLAFFYVVLIAGPHGRERWFCSWSPITGTYVFANE